MTDLKAQPRFQTTCGEVLNISIEEAARLTGLSVETLERMEKDWAANGMPMAIPVTKGNA